MFHKSPDERLIEWSSFRRSMSHFADPLMALVQFWSQAPLIIHNNKIDPYNPKSWPTPWEIIYENKYDDFTLAIMMGYTLKLSKKFNNDKIEVKTMVDNVRKQLYNLVYINDIDVLNYERHTPVKAQDIKDCLYLENTVNIIFPR
jgi:hypothetical protein